MNEEIVVDHEATLRAVRDEAEMWRTAKDRLAEKLADTDTENARLNARVDHVERSLFRESERVIHAEEALAAERAQHRADYEAALELTELIERLDDALIVWMASFDYPTTDPSWEPFRVAYANLRRVMPNGRRR